LYEQAAIAYRFKKENEKAKDAFEKASKGQEMISSYPSEKKFIAVVFSHD
jgi:hypothetical protein